MLSKRGGRVEGMKYLYGKAGFGGLRALYTSQ